MSLELALYSSEALLRLLVNLLIAVMNSTYEQNQVGVVFNPKHAICSHPPKGGVSDILGILPGGCLSLLTGSCDVACKVCIVCIRCRQVEAVLEFDHESILPLRQKS